MIGATKQGAPAPSWGWIALAVCCCAAFLGACSSARPGASNLGDVQDVPAPPSGALDQGQSSDRRAYVQVSAPAGASAGQTEVVIRTRVYRTQAATADILAFYQQQLPPRGWAVPAGGGTPESGRLLFVRGSGAVVERVNITIAAGTTGLTVTIVDSTAMAGVQTDAPGRRLAALVAGQREDRHERWDA